MIMRIIMIFKVSQSFVLFFLSPHTQTNFPGCKKSFFSLSIKQLLFKLIQTWITDKKILFHWL